MGWVKAGKNRTAEPGWDQQTDRSLVGARTASRGERWGQLWKVEAPSPHASVAVGPLAREAGPGLGAPSTSTQALTLPKQFHSFLADMCMRSAGSLQKLHLASLCSSEGLSNGVPQVASEPTLSSFCFWKTFFLPQAAFSSFCILIASAPFVWYTCNLQVVKMCFSRLQNSRKRLSLQA